MSPARATPPTHVCSTPVTSVRAGATRTAGSNTAGAGNPWSKRASQGYSGAGSLGKPAPMLVYPSAAQFSRGIDSEELPRPIATRRDFPHALELSDLPAFVSKEGA